MGAVFCKLLSGNVDFVILSGCYSKYFPFHPNLNCFIYLLVCFAENDLAFDILYCITFRLMDQQWLSMHASYMDFNVRYYAYSLR